ncbi:ankyrin repeat domain-containing protein 54, partial [Biomphalaria glabrata]
SSLHVAIQYSSIDVLKVLLKYGVDPNEPSNFTSRSRRNSNYSSSDVVSPTVPYISLPGVQQHSHSEISRQHSPSPHSHSSEQPYTCEEEKQHLTHATQTSSSTTSISQSVKQSTSSKIARRSYEWGSLSSQTSGVTRSPASSRAGPFAAHLPEIVETSVENGFNFSEHYSKDELLNLPCLYLAVVDGNPYVVQLLLRYGAQPNVQDSHGCSPLHLACSQDYFNLENIRSLLKYGAKIHMKNVNQDSPCSLYPDIVSEQKAVVRTALARINIVVQPSKPRSRTSTITNPALREYPMPSTPTHDQTASSSRSGSVSRFFKRLSSDARPRGRRITRDESSNFTSDVMRERTYSSGSCKSLRSRHYSSCVVDDLESDFSMVRKAYILYSSYLAHKS